MIKTFKQKLALEGIKKNNLSALIGGSASGKSVLAVHCLITRALLYPNSTHLIVRRYQTSIRRSIWMQTIPFIIKQYGIKDKVKCDKTQMIVSFSNGSKVMCVGIDNELSMDKLLGIECSTIFIDECTEVSYDQYQLLVSRMREKICKQNRILLCCNPTSKKSWIYKFFCEHKDPKSGESIPINPFVIQMNPIDNKDNISEDYIKQLEQLSSRQRMRFLNGEWLSDVEGALFKFEDIEKNRKEEKEYERIIIGVDPAVTNNENSDETGIIVAGMKNDHYYVLRDESGKLSPSEVVNKIVALTRLYKADKIIVETNQGGDWLLDSISHKDPHAPLEGKHQKVGKLIRAEPVAFLYEKGLVHHIKQFIELEDQLISWAGKGDSPDRLDAMVITIGELSYNGEPKLDLTFADNISHQLSDDL